MHLVKGGGGIPQSGLQPNVENQRLQNEKQRETKINILIHP